MPKGLTSEQFRKMGVITKDDKVITFEELLRRQFAGVFDEMAKDYGKRHDPRSKDKAT